MKSLMVTLNTDDIPVQLKAVMGILAAVVVTLPCMLIMFNLVCCHSPLVQPPPLRGLSPRANYTDRAAAAGRRS